MAYNPNWFASAMKNPFPKEKLMIPLSGPATWAAVAASDRPATPVNQPTKPASTNAPARKPRTGDVDLTSCIAISGDWGDMA